MKTNSSYPLLRVSFLREHDQVIAEMVELWLARQAKRQPKPQPAVRMQRTTNSLQ
ncbi:TPA: hypothetical protein NI674_006110 [Pseudomonas aeruginosa]|uniref:hypothetical protein n=1 Tax=Pseudomonas aeruginosa group TaxID=136841 RepID=UPI000A800DE6|nr:hypothetical protein [Pseudomonas aeruginosa]MBN0001441.1 hypothetical protein [Pseudomonas aeruginosa]MBN0090965.1 hypothetical protein [Pseudomonas aeruginosa]MBN0147197.1 hypothetical protein [Pseudomonas aeruginosa]MBN0300861.1 hypothetical protein [Pseudomonas aeruginosa]MBN0321164.1 hypothetical protein [Pseudomonas aeruginosa]